MHNLIPHFISEHLEAGLLQGEMEAVTLFMDLSGFTTMSQRLMQRGKAGAETLAHLINQGLTRTPPWLSRLT